MEETLDEKIARVLAQSKQFTDIRLTPPRERGGKRASEPIMKPKAEPKPTTAASTLETESSQVPSSESQRAGNDINVATLTPSRSTVTQDSMTFLGGEDASSNRSSFSAPTEFQPVSPKKAHAIPTTPTQTHTTFSSSSISHPLAEPQPAMLEPPPYIAMNAITSMAESIMAVGKSSVQAVGLSSTAPAQVEHVSELVSSKSSEPSPDVVQTLSSKVQPGTPTTPHQSTSDCSTSTLKSKPNVSSSAAPPVTVPSPQLWSVSAESMGLITNIDPPHPQPRADKSAIMYVKEKRAASNSSRDGASQGVAYQQRRFSAPAQGNVSSNASLETSMGHVGSMMGGWLGMGGTGAAAVPNVPLNKLSIDLSTAWSIQLPPNSGSVEGTVSVAVRIRPFSIGEVQNGGRRIVSSNANKIVIVNPSTFVDPDAALSQSTQGIPYHVVSQSFVFDHCLWSYSPGDSSDEYCDQHGVYAAIGQGLVDSAMKGVSATCFAYGQTGTGKTHSLFGSVRQAPDNSQEVSAVDSASFLLTDFDSSERGTEQAGLVHRVFGAVLAKVQSNHLDTTVLFSFVELYNEKIRDLLNPQQTNTDSIRARDHPSKGVIIEGVTQRPVKDLDEIASLLHAGHACRASAWSAWIPTSSRSHLIVQLELIPTVQYEADCARVPVTTGWRSVKVTLVDLAGSEWVEGPGATPNDPRISEALRGETKSVHRSLAAVGTIVKALSKREQPSKLSYRDSLLTWLLRESLSAGSHAVILTTISPSHSNFDESLKTLRYAERLCRIKTRGFTFGDYSVKQFPSAPSSSTKRSNTPSSSTPSKTRSPNSAAKKFAFLQRSGSRIDAGHGQTKPAAERKTESDAETVEPDPDMAALFADELRQNYAMLARQHSELQKELVAIRSDRDQMLREVQRFYQERGGEGAILDNDDGHGPSGNLTAVSAETARADKAEKSLAELREKVSLLLKRNIILEDAVKKSHAEELAAIPIRQSLQSELNALRQVASEMSILKGQVGAAEARAAHWQHVATQALQGQDGAGAEHPDLAESTSSSDPPTLDSRAALLAATLAENQRLEAELLKAQIETKDVKAQLLSSQSSMQKEFSSLWTAVQELNRLDAVKEHALNELISEKDQANSKLARAILRCQELESEIHSMDRVLEEAVLEEERKTRDIRSPKMNASTPIAVNKSPHHSAFSALPQSPFSTAHVLPASVAEGSDSTPRRSAWKASAISPNPIGSANRGLSPRTVNSPREELDASGEKALDRQLNLLSKFLVNDKSVLRINKLREQTAATFRPPSCSFSAVKDIL